jgi:hypothetical protein
VSTPSCCACLRSRLRSSTSFSLGTQSRYDSRRPYGSSRFDWLIAPPLAHGERGEPDPRTPGGAVMLPPGRCQVMRVLFATFDLLALVR